MLLIMARAFFRPSASLEATLTRAGIVHIDLGAGLLDDAANGSAALADQIANLVGGNLHRLNARRILRALRARSIENRIHLVEQEEPAAASLLHGLLQDLARQAADLDVHLQGGDALAGAGDLEVHIAVVIFGAGDVGKNGVVVAFLHQSHRYACNCALERNAASKSARLAPQTDAIEDEPFDSRMSETMRIE